ncbi:unnamed protein product [Somion occarium]|uniref:Uncharacterized protein n=1 Tax=Somion occarium TaxID=3059160 RepID=A0ABP1CV54_9APHY
MEAPSTNVQVASNNNQSTNDKQTALDIISETFPPFDHRGKIVAPFDNETKRDAEFQESLSIMLLALMLEFHAWSSARPMQESDRTADALEKEINELMGTEKEQEKTRQRLKDFVERIKMALAALTALVPG